MLQSEGKSVRNQVMGDMVKLQLCAVQTQHCHQTHYNCFNMEKQIQVLFMFRLEEAPFFSAFYYANGTGTFL